MFLGQERINEIEFKSRALIDAVYPNGVELPIDLAKILAYYQLDLFLTDFADKQVAGAYNRSEKSIYVHQDDHRNRMVFTIAHELGHHVLHEGSTDVETFYRWAADLIKSEDSVQETEANWFAASLLMPEIEVMKYFNETKGDISKLSIIFGVSNSAMYWRLKNLQLI